MPKIDERAVIAPDVQLGEDVKIAPFCVIDPGAKLGDRVNLGVGCVVEAGAEVGSDVALGNYVTVTPRTKIGAGTRVGHSTVLGRYPRPAANSTVKNQPAVQPLVVGANCIIGCLAVAYAGTELGEGVFMGDRAVVRENCRLGANVVVGSGSIVENQTTIGARTKIQSGAYITAHMEIEEEVFIAPMVVTTNDNFMGRTEKRFQLTKGATIRRRARIGGGAVLLPGVEIAPETFVAAGALVTKDTEAAKIVWGHPARLKGDVPAEEMQEE